MKVECVQVCVNYSDFLAHTLVFNKYNFDKMVVVTSDKDVDTARVCEYYHIECIKTNLFDDGFNKGKAINLGLSKLDRSGWVVHLDSDMILPPRTRYLLEIAKLREDTLYGIDRQMCASYEEFAEWMVEPFVNHECDIYLHSHAPFRLGTRLGRLTTDPKHYSDLGYCPIGFFQMWHYPTYPDRKYPETFNNGGGSDMCFAYQWPREKRGIIPEIVGAIHLQTDDAKKMGINWTGRKTQRFGPQQVMESGVK